MQPLVTLYERQPAPIETLPPELAKLYDGGFQLPEGLKNGQPYVIANFVETIDGIVSYNAPGQTGGGVISGNNEQDKMVMGLLRAVSDAVIFGSSSLREDANHIRIPSFIAPEYANAYNAWRSQLGKQEQYPITVVMTASGQVNLSDRSFHTPGLHAIIATTKKGYEHLSHQILPKGTEIRVIESPDASETAVSPHNVLKMLAIDYNVRIALYEGGPNLLASFLVEQSIDELFLTLAPQIAGHSQHTHRLSLVEGHAFTPKEAPWATLLSVKLASSHLLLRYGLPKGN